MKSNQNHLSRYFLQTNLLNHSNRGLLDVADSLGSIGFGGKANDELKAMLAKLIVTNEELKMLVNAGGGIK